jgi:hypothetical protein
MCITSALCVTYGAIGISSVWVSASVPQLTLSATSPANPTLGLAYSAQFSASGGVAPYSFSLSQGSLPPGLSIDPATGTVSGIPTGVGTYRFTVTLTDNSNPSQSVSAPVTMVVGASLAATGADHSYGVAYLIGGGPISGVQYRCSQTSSLFDSIADTQT